MPACRTASCDLLCCTEYKKGSCSLCSRRSESEQALKTGLHLVIGFGEEFFLKAEIISMQVCRSSHRNEGGFQGPRIPFNCI